MAVEGGTVSQYFWVTFLAETSKDLEIILITIVLSFTNIVFHALAFVLALRQVSFIQTSSVWLKLSIIFW